MQPVVRPAATVIPLADDIAAGSDGLSAHPTVVGHRRHTTAADSVPQHEGTSCSTQVSR
jgi:hypothetical protein